VGITAGTFVDVNRTLDLLVTGKVIANGNVNITAGTNITVDDLGVRITADSDSNNVGDLTLYAGGLVTSHDGGTPTILSGENVTITALTGTGAFDQIKSNRNNNAVGDVSITTAGNTDFYGAVQAGATGAGDFTGNVTVVSGGAITTHSGAPITDAQDVSLTAGSTDTTLAVSLSDLIRADRDVSIVATNGGVTTAGAATITATGGGVFIAADDLITLNGNVLAGGAGAAYPNGDVIKITTINTVAGDNVVINGTLHTTGASAADINIDPYDTTVNNTVTSDTGSVEITTARNATFAAAGDINAGGDHIEIRANTGVITMANGTVFTATGGPTGGRIYMKAAGDVTLGQLFTNNNTPFAVDITSQTGGIIDGGDTGGADINATQPNAVVTLQANTGIGSAAGGGADPALETDIVNLIAQNQTSGAIWIDEANALNILRAFNVGAGTGAITITALGSVVVDGVGSGVFNGGTASPINIYAGDATHTATLTVNQEIISTGGAIGLFAEDDAIFGPLGSVYSNGGNIFVWADSDFDENGSGGALTMSHGTIFDAGAGKVDLRADERITVGEVRSLNTDNDAVQITTTSADVVDGNGNDLNVFANDGGLIITAVTGIGGTFAAPDALETQVGRLDLYNQLTGLINIVEMDAVTIAYAVQDTPGVVDPNRDITILAGGTITVEDNGVLATPAVSTVNAGNILLAANGPTSDIFVNDGVVNNTGNISIIADHNLTFNIHGDVTSNTGNLLLMADGESAHNGGFLVMIDNGLDTATAITGTGTITVSADGDVVIGRLVTNNTTDNAVRVTSTSGAIVDGGDTDVWDIEALGGGAAAVHLKAETGIGDGNALEIRATTITGDTHLNDVEIFNNSNGADVLVPSLTTTEGDIVFTQAGGGDIFFVWVNAHGHGNGNFGEVHLANTGNNADIYVGDIFSTTTITITADGSILNDGLWVANNILPDGIAGTDISGENVFLTALHETIGVWGMPVEVQVDGVGALRVFAGGMQHGWLSVNLQGLEPWSLVPNTGIPGIVLYNVAGPGRIIRDGGSAALFDSNMTRQYFQATAQDSAWLATEPEPYALFLDIFGDAVFAPYPDLYSVEGVQPNKDE
jgi:hypothetical protein